MKSNYFDTAILIFALSKEAENKRKPFMALQSLGEVLHISTLNKVKNTGLDYYHFDEYLQQGNTFGDRITHATQAIFDKGYQNVIIIGNDTPGLTSKILKDTSKCLKNDTNVIGLSKDGGLYLIGISKKSFDRDEFQKLAWEDSQLSSSFLKLMHQKATNVFCLRTLYDVDSFQDLLKIKLIELGDLAQFTILLLSSLRSIANNIFFENKLLTSFVYQYILGTRGSPLKLFR
ncbi:hypothetical protein GCM10011344_45710 [Dokdonia pacifica]|nr:DUF2064 domain-containing protein [Dokdonia pacifica]GGG39732.1 hypothetical protein GCM10011344_45710 [Dokdonia pacifica]